ncbi:hypothetical protein [Halohasta salina]|uniref:hypothetical protein n=1 Tax=Halohasta salina TaxID=2961621 RepID=UPI0020A5100D|nr:hypothetical protein [Halohasta salina]
MQKKSARGGRSTATDAEIVLAADADPEAADRRLLDGTADSDRSATGSTAGVPDGRQSPTEPAISADELAALAAELRSLKQAVESLAERRSTADEPTTGGFEWVESPQSTAPVEPLAERIEALESRAAAIESALDAVPPAELEAAVERQQAAYDDLESRLEADLDGIEAVFEQLLSTTDRLDERLDEVEAAREAAIEPLQRRTAEQAALVELTQAALRHDVSTADCDHCEQSVDVGMLETPYCPGCGHQFTRIDAGGWLPFSSATLRTAKRHDAEPTHR